MEYEASLRTSGSGDRKRYFPSLSAAKEAGLSLSTKLWFRSTDLLRFTPVEERQLAAVVVTARLTGSEESWLLRYAYAPPMGFALQEGVARLLDPSGFTPPSALAFDIRQVSHEGLYRGAANGEPTLDGWRFGDAHRQAGRVVDDLRRRHGPAVRIDTFGWPVLYARYSIGGGGRRVALLVRPDGDLQAFLIH